MVIGIILCIIGNYVCCYLAARAEKTEGDLKKQKNKSNFYFVTAFVLSVTVAVLLINLIDSNSNGAGAAKYNYYINGKKVSSQTYVGTQNLFIGMMICGFFFGTGMTLSAKMIKNKNKPKEDPKNKKPNVVTLVLSIFAIINAFVLVASAISALTHSITSNSTTAPIIAIIIAIACLALGIWGIAVFIKRKKHFNKSNEA